MPSVHELNRVGEKVHALIAVCRDVLEKVDEQNYVLIGSPSIVAMRTLVERIDYAGAMKRAAIQDGTYYPVKDPNNESASH